MSQNHADFEVLPPESGSGRAQPPTPSEQNWAMLCHLSAGFIYILPFGGHLLGPLAVWLYKGKSSPLVDDQGKESLNFQISMTIYYFAGAIFIIALFGILLLAILHLFHLILTVVAAVKARGGERYRYPLTIRLIR